MMMVHLLQNLKCKLNLHQMKSRLFCQKEWMFVIIRHLPNQPVMTMIQIKQINLLKRCKSRMKRTISRTQVKLFLSTKYSPRHKPLLKSQRLKIRLPKMSRKIRGLILLTFLNLIFHKTNGQVFQMTLMYTKQPLDQCL